MEEAVFRIASIPWHIISSQVAVPFTWEWRNQIHAATNHHRCMSLRNVIYQATINDRMDVLQWRKSPVMLERHIFATPLGLKLIDNN